MVSNKTRKLLSDAAKQSYKTNTNFKNQSYDRMCQWCNTHFIAKASNTKFCPDCKLIGYKKICEKCNDAYRAKYRDGKYCQLCATPSVFLKGKPRPVDVKEKCRISQTAWSRTTTGKKFYIRNGKENSKKLKLYFQTEVGKRQRNNAGKLHSVAMKKKIRDGEYTPRITNTWTHWDANVMVNRCTYRFRSSWEACFWLCNQQLEYETIRVPRGKSSVICDFIDQFNRIIYEIKPRSRYRPEKHKINAIIKWCLSNNYKFIWINESNILNYIDTTKFNGKNKRQLDKLMKGLKYAKVGD